MTIDFCLYTNALRTEISEHSHAGMQGFNLSVVFLPVVWSRVTNINTEHASQASKRTLHKPTAPGYSCISDSRMRIYCVLVFAFFNSIVDLLDCLNKGLEE